MMSKKLRTAELELHAVEELQHALAIAKQIDYLGSSPTVVAQPVKTSRSPATAPPATSGLRLPSPVDATVALPEEVPCDVR